MANDAQDLLRHILWREINDAHPADTTQIFQESPPTTEVRQALLLAASRLATTPTSRLNLKHLTLLVGELSDSELLEVWEWSQKAAGQSRKRASSEFVASTVAQWITDDFDELKRLDPVAISDELVRVGVADLDSPWRFLADNAQLAPDREYAVKVVPSPVAGLPHEGEVHVALYDYPGGIAVAEGPAVGTFISDGSHLSVSRQPAGSPSPAATQPMLFRIRTPAMPGTYKLRCSVFFGDVTLQSRSLTIPVGAGGAVHTYIDYRLATLFPPKLKQQPGPHLSFMMNSDGSGTHTLRYFGHHPLGVGSATFDANEITQQISSARSALRRASWGDDGEWNPEKRYRYEHLDLGQLSNDLRNLAIKGRRFYVYLADKLRPNRGMWNLEPMLRMPGGIELTIREDARLLLPISLAYDHPLHTNAEEHILCDTFVAAVENQTPLNRTRCFQGDCRYFGRTHIICPSGFWGFRHRIAFPVSRRSAGALPSIAPSTTPDVVIGTSTDPELRSRARHLTAVTQLMSAMQPVVADSRDSLFRAFRERSPHLVYLFCHAGTQDEAPYFHIGDDAEPNITGDDLYTERINWSHTRPLAFINGCETAAVTPEMALSLVTPFIDAGASGVIGTEITAFEPLATVFAEHFLETFLSGETAAESVRQARLELLLRGNPLGLIYVPFAPSFTALMRLPVVHAA